jgi:hypothetical protein
MNIKSISANHRPAIGWASVTYSEVATAVLEPSTWAMLLLGFAGIGFLVIDVAL